MSPQPRQHVIDRLIAFLGANPDLHENPNRLRTEILRRWPDISDEEFERASKAVLAVLEATVIEGLARTPPRGHA
jgi:hypothetical protein